MELQLDNLHIWYGDTMGMENKRWRNRAFNYTPTIRRNKGRPIITLVKGAEDAMQDKAIDK